MLSQMFPKMICPLTQVQAVSPYPPRSHKHQPCHLGCRMVAHTKHMDFLQPYAWCISNSNMFLLQTVQIKSFFVEGVRQELYKRRNIRISWHPCRMEWSGHKLLGQFEIDDACHPLEEAADPLVLAQCDPTDQRMQGQSSKQCKDGGQCLH